MGEAAKNFLEAEFLLEALSMVNKGWKLGDAVHYLTMVKHDMRVIVTDDGHFDIDNLKGIERINLMTMTF